MTDILLSSFLSLFALFGKKEQVGDKEIDKRVIKTLKDLGCEGAEGSDCRG